MKLGYFTMPLHPPGSDPAATLAEDLEQLIRLDRLGYAEAWIGEHFTSEWEDIPCPDLLIAQALGLTKNIVLGTGVSCLPNHHPVMLAQRIAQLDQMARGRFHWGVGSGGFGGDFKLFDVDDASFEQRGLTREILDAVLELWAEPKPGLREHRRWRYRVPDVEADVGVRLHMQPYQKPHPPIGVAGISPKSDMLTLAGERGWIPMSINIVPVSTVRAQWQVYSESAGRVGRVPDRSCWRISRDVYVAETSERARRQVLDGPIGRDWRDYFLPLLRKAKLMIAPKVDPAMPDEAVTLEYLCDNIWIVGDVDEVAAKLRRLYEEVGGFGTLLVIGHEWGPDDGGGRSAGLLMEKVLPRLRDLA
jgi:alkanesulfonate monooxygenase SsuD/methylene tetrahydromethanopterin reductase-like flavin-dependent oxidoreductase (luciferase family)